MAAKTKHNNYAPLKENKYIKMFLNVICRSYVAINAIWQTSNFHFNKMLPISQEMENEPSPSSSHILYRRSYNICFPNSVYIFLVDKRWTQKIWSNKLHWISFQAKSKHIGFLRMYFVPCSMAPFYRPKHIYKFVLMAIFFLGTLNTVYTAVSLDLGLPSLFFG